MQLCRCFRATSSSDLTLSDKEQKRILDRGYRLFCRVHTDGTLAVRDVKKALWTQYPSCGIAGNALALTRTKYVIQLAIIFEKQIPPGDLVTFLSTEFSNNILKEEEWFHDAMTGVVACVVNGKDMWYYYLYQLFMSQGIDRTVVAAVTFGESQSQWMLQKVEEPSSKAVSDSSRDPDSLVVFQPSTIVEFSTTAPRDQLFAGRLPTRHVSEDSDDKSAGYVASRNPTPIVSPLASRPRLNTDKNDPAFS